MNELQQIQSLYQAMKNGKLKYGEYTAKVMPLINAVKSTGDVSAAAQVMQFDPYYIHQQQQAKNQANLGALTQLGTELYKTGVAADQINSAKRGLNGLTLPSVPAAPGYNNQLTEQLYQAERRANDVGYAVNPATQQINQAYNQAVQEAQANSGGQQSNYQAQANLANYQRMQAALGLVPLAQQARIQNQGVVNDLLGQRMQEQQNMFQNQLYGTQLAQDQYNRAAQAYGQLGAAGGYNMVNTVSQIPQYLQYLPFDDKTNQYMQDTHVATENAVRNGLQGIGLAGLGNNPMPGNVLNTMRSYNPNAGIYNNPINLQGYQSPVVNTPVFNPIKIK